MDEPEVDRLDAADEMVQRYDVRRLGRVRETAQGFLRIDANLTRVGILEYTQPDGTIRRELRRPGHVFSEQSLDTMKGAPLIDSTGAMHSVARVTPDNYQGTAVGHVTDDVRADGKMMRATIIVQDRATINRIKAGERRELSAGYRAKMDNTGGEFEGQRYDAEQTAIVYNHVCLLPEGAGRAGSDVAMKLDAADAVSVDRQDAGALGLFIQKQIELLKLDEIQLAKKAGMDEFQVGAIIAGVAPPTDSELQRIASAIGSTLEQLKKMIPRAERRDTKTTETQTMKVTLHLDGVAFDVECPDALGEDLKRRFQTQSESLTNEKTRADAAEKTRDEQKDKLDAAEKELKDVKDPKHIQQRIKDRVALQSAARHVLDAKEVDDDKLDSMSDLEIRQAVIAEAQPEFKLDGLEEPALVGLFDFVTQQAAGDGDDDGNDDDKGRQSRKDARTAVNKGRKTPDKDGDGDDDEKLDATAARKKFTENSRKAWEQPLGHTKNAQS